MELFIDEERIEQEKLTFEVFNQFAEITKESLLFRAEAERFEFFTTGQLSNIATEEMKKGRVGWEKDIGVGAGVYIFTSLVSRRVLKVGETQTLRQRIADDHLRYWNQGTTADLCGLYHSRGLPWPQSLVDDEITLCIISMPNSKKLEREAMEKWLQAKLDPLLN